MSHRRFAVLVLGLAAATTASAVASHGFSFLSANLQAHRAEPSATVGAPRSQAVTATPWGSLESPAAATRPTLKTAVPTRVPAPTQALAPAPTRAPAPTPTPITAWPSATNTGVPAGTVLHSVGSISVTTPGAVFDSLDIAACVDILASNVTIKRSRIHSGNCGLGTEVVKMADNVSGVLIVDTEIDGLNADASNSGIMGGGGYTCLRCNIHGVGNGFNPWGSHPVTIKDSWVHDLYVRDDLGSHNQDVITNGFAAGLVIRHNTLENWAGQTATIALFADFSAVQNVTADDNLLNGGGYCVYGAANDGKPYSGLTRNIVFTNNHFGRKFHPKCGYWGPAAYVDLGLPGNRWSGNVWDDTNTPITP